MKKIEPYDLVYKHEFQKKIQHSKTETSIHFCQQTIGRWIHVVYKKFIKHEIKKQTHDQFMGGLDVIIRGDFY